LPLLEQLGFVVWLRADEEVLFERVSRNSDRPLLQTDNPRETLRQMIRERTPLYERASQFIIDTSWLRPADLAGAVLNEMRRRGL
jgi:shikimate kinase